MNKNYAVSDLHGMLPLWRQIQEHCDETDTIYVLGDAADRGPDSWETLKEVFRDPRVRYVRGNHDQMLLDAMGDDEYREDVNLWFSNGGYITYDQMMQDPDYRRYLYHLSKQPYYRCYERANGTKIHLSHAGYTLFDDDQRPHRDLLIWDREHWTDRAIMLEQGYIVCGHTPIISSTIKRASMVQPFEFNDSYTVAKSGNKILIDAGCFCTNKIALLDLDTFEEVVFNA